jgi:hypothetical protein
MQLCRPLCLIQGAYFLITGIWPIVSIETFQLVTGKKTDNLVTGREADHWLVNTVGVLVIAIGITCVFAARRRSFSVEVAVMAITSAVGLTCIDVVYHARGTISAVYLVDAALEVAFVIAWGICLISHSRETGKQ